MEQHLTYAWSTLIALAAGGVYVFNRTDWVYSPYLNTFAVAYFVDDFFKCPPLYKIHHVCTGCLLFALWVQHNPLLSFFLYKTELTTLLYNLLPYVPKACKPYVMGAFFLSFLKIRVLDYYTFLQDPAVEAFFVKSAVLRGCFYALYAINLYWFSLMIKKMWGERTKGPRYAVLCQKVAAYSYLGVLPAATACPKMLFVHTFTAITSFFYHNAVAANAPRVNIFILDSVAVHAVTFLNMSSVTSLWVYTSAVVNLAALAARVALVPQYDLAIQMSYLPILCDGYIIVYSNASTTLKFDYALQLYLIFLCFQVKFLNEMSFICFHIIMWFNTRTMAQLVCVDQLVCSYFSI